MSKQMTRLLCAIVFSVFTFCYLFWYQSDVMVITQYIASGGQTHYNRLVGALLITLTLQLLQVGINAIARLRLRSLAFTYLPSAIILTFITDISPEVEGTIDIGAWTWAMPLLLILSGLIIWGARCYQAYEPDERYDGPMSQIVWINLAVMVVLLFGVGLFSNHDSYFHQQCRMERLIGERNYKGALAEVRRMPHTTPSVSMMTIYALARQQHLGDSLFAYPIADGTPLRPTANVHSLLQPDSIIVKTTKKSANYQLCALLLSRDLDTFTRILPEYYPVNDSLPRHYREAWDLYMSQIHGKPLPRKYRKDSYLAYYFRKN